MLLACVGRPLGLEYILLCAFLIGEYHQSPLSISGLVNITRDAENHEGNP